MGVPRTALWTLGESKQRYSTASDQRHLLGKALQEGACDMIGEPIAGRTINEHLKIYGRTHDAEIWRDFEAEMYKPDISNWFYNARTAKDRPADLGYYVGYLITQAYYRNAKDKRQAVHDILNIQDACAFYEASGVRQNTVNDKQVNSSNVARHPGS